jgi:hypothetical protein
MATQNLSVRLEGGDTAEIPDLTGLNFNNTSGTAAAATPVVMDTGFAPPPGQTAALSVLTNVDDRATPASAANLDVVSVKTSALGVLTVSGTPVNVAKTGTAALIAGAFAVSYSVSAHNTLVVTVTPPAAYPATLFATSQIQAVVG